MLVLARKELESIAIYTTDGRIEITIAEIRAGRCSLAIKGPRSVKVLRTELERDTEDGK